jgi:hypothetical protein
MMTVFKSITWRYATHILWPWWLRLPAILWHDFQFTHSLVPNPHLFFSFFPSFFFPTQFEGRVDLNASCDDVLPPENQTYSHGTAVSSVMAAAANNNECSVGIAP